MTGGNECIPDAAVLIKLAKIRMPFGKYKEWRLIDLPEPYVVWFAQKGFPAGQLGNMLQIHRYMDSSPAVFYGQRKLADYDARGKLKEPKK
ncbi:MAG: DUF3820 family protein, partial [Desulfobacterales bacterium]|nr:DUF3820 family protein [Desulfobacterales bacterium]